MKSCCHTFHLIVAFLMYPRGVFERTVCIFLWCQNVSSKSICFSRKIILCHKYELTASILPGTQRRLRKILYCPSTVLVIIYKALWKKIVVWHSYSFLRRNILFPQTMFKTYLGSQSYGYLPWYWIIFLKLVVLKKRC